MNPLPWYLERGTGPLLATAIHNGHDIREEIAPFMAISEQERLREEDPGTGRWTDVAPSRIIGHRSRFEVDLNRPRKKAVYRVPADAWGLEVWKNIPNTDTIEKSLAIYDAFYQEAHLLLKRMVARYGKVVVFDLHTYNHRRGGPDATQDDPMENPDINLGTGTMERSRWSSIIDRFIVDLRNFDFLGRSLDVRENVRFRGGYFAQWVHNTFPDSVCVLSIEVKKFFMNEWTGTFDPLQTAAVRRALKSTIWGIYEELIRLESQQLETPIPEIAES